MVTVTDTVYGYVTSATIPVAAFSFPLRRTCKATLRTYAESAKLPHTQRQYEKRGTTLLAPAPSGEGSRALATYGVLC